MQVATATAADVSYYTDFVGLSHEPEGGSSSACGAGRSPELQARELLAVPSNSASEQGLVGTTRTDPALYEGGSSRGAASPSHALDLALEDAATVDWATRLHDIMQLPAEDSTSTLEKAQQLHRLHCEFGHVCAVICRQIIQQLGQARESWRIQPDSAAGGIAGGEKYLAGNIFIKFARDSGVYGGDDGASKAARQELCALRSLLTASVPGLSLPLMATVDVGGFRLVCASKLPLTGESLVYGSADAGKTVHTDDAEFNRIMRTVCEQLGLAGHNVGRPRVDSHGQLQHTVKLLWGPVDIEGHRLHMRSTCEDAAACRRYVLDTARLFPPMSQSDLPNHPRVPMSTFPADEAKAVHQTFAFCRSRGNWALASSRGQQKSLLTRVKEELLSCLAQDTVTAIRARLAAPAQGAKEAEEEHLHEEDLIKVLPVRREVVSEGWLFSLPRALAEEVQDARDMGANSRVAQHCGMDITGPAVLVQDVGTVFFRLFRPEILSQSALALSSDVFTGFGACGDCTSLRCAHGSRPDFGKARHLTIALLQCVLPALAADICSGGVLLPDSASLVRVMHKRGVPLCLLGELLLRALTEWNEQGPKPDDSGESLWFRQVIHTEMLARCLKSLLKRRMRRAVLSCSDSVDEAIGRCTVDFLAEAFLQPVSWESRGAGHAGQDFWEAVRFEGERKFGTWACCRDWPSMASAGTVADFLPHATPKGMLFSRLAELLHLNHAHPAFQLLLDHAAGEGPSVGPSLPVQQVLQGALQAIEESDTPILFPKVKSMFDADLMMDVVQSHIRCERGGSGAAVAADAANQSARDVLALALDSFRATDRSMRLILADPSAIAPRAVFWGGRSMQLGSPAEERLVFVALRQLVQAALRSRDLAMASSVATTLAKGTSTVKVLSVAQCGRLATLAKCQAATGHPDLAINTVKTAMLHLQRLAPVHPLLGQLNCTLAQAMLEHPSPRGRALAAVAVDDAFKTFHALYGTAVRIAVQKSATSRAVSSIDVLIPLILMGCADQVGEYLGGLVASMTSVSQGSTTPDVTPPAPSRRSVDRFLDSRDAGNLEVLDQPRLWRAEARSAFSNHDIPPEPSLSVAGSGQAAPLHLPPQAQPLARQVTSSLSMLDSLDEPKPGQTAVNPMEADAATRCIQRSVASMRVLEQFLGLENGYFDQVSTSDQSIVLSSARQSMIASAPTSSAATPEATFQVHMPACPISAGTMIAVVIHGIDARRLTCVATRGVHVHEAFVEATQELRCTASFRLVKAGEYTVRIFTSSDAGQPLQVYEGALNVVPGAIDSEMCTFEAPSTVEEGDELLARVIVRDSFGNIRSDPEDALQLSWRAGFGRDKTVDMDFVEDLPVEGAIKHNTRFAWRAAAAGCAEAAPGKVAPAHCSAVSLLEGKTHPSSARVQLEDVEPACFAWRCVLLADVVVGKVSLTWTARGARYRDHGAPCHTLTVRKNPAAHSRYCGQRIMVSIGGGAIPAKVCQTCTLSLGNTCLRCSGRVFHGGRHLLLCQFCARSHQIGMNQRCCVCKGSIMPATPSSDAKECQACTRRQHLQTCIGLK